VSSFVSEVVPALFGGLTMPPSIDVISLLMVPVHKLRSRRSAIGSSLPSHRCNSLAQGHDNACIAALQLPYYPTHAGEFASEAIPVESYGA
jgi:hypothetical protein